MSISVVIIALCWGGLVGYLLLRGIDSLIGLLFCVHGLFERRWKKLADKNATGLVRPRLILKLALRLGCYAAICGLLFSGGDEFLRREYRFHYDDVQGYVFAGAAVLVLLSRLYVSWRRMKLVWRMTHEFDFAERRERTRLLKS